MPNRIIKESICTSDTIDKLTWFEEVFFYRLIVNCDDYGRFDARTSILKARLFPLKNVSEEDIVNTLANLSKTGLLQIYEYENKPYLQLTTWADHQTIRNKRSKFPSIEEAETLIEYNCNQVNTKVPVIQSNPIQSESNPNPIQSNGGHEISNTDVKKKNKKIESIKEQLDAFTTDEEFKAILNQFVDMRKKIRKPLTDYAFKLILKKLTNLSKDVTIQMDIVNQSIVSSWADVYPLKQNYQRQFGNQKQAPIPEWYNQYETNLKKPRNEAALKSDEIEKILKQAGEEL